MDVRSGVGERSGLDRVHPASKADGQRETGRSPKPAFSGPELDDACACFPIFAIRFHSELADPPTTSV